MNTKALSKIKSNAGIPLAQAALCPGTHCPMHPALILLGRIPKLATLLVGSGECCYYSQFVSAQAPEGLHWAYKMEAKEVVFGSEEGVSQALVELDSRGCELIVLIMTCLPALIGEDPQRWINGLEGKIRAKLVYLDLAHFKTKAYYEGFSQTYRELAKSQRDPKELPDPKLVYFLGTAPEDGFLRTYLEKEGFRVKNLDQKLSLDLFREVQKARILVLWNSRFEALAQYLEEEACIPSLSFWTAWLPEDYEKQYRRLEEELGLQEKLSFEVPPSFTQGLTKVLEDFEGWSFDAFFQNEDNLSLSYALVRLGLKPRCIHIDQWMDQYSEIKEGFLARSLDPDCAFVPQGEGFCRSFEDEHHLRLQGRALFPPGFQRLEGLIKLLYEVRNQHGLS